MKSEIRNKKIEEVIQKASEIKEIMSTIVWERQEGQKEHFDSLNKAEQIALIGIYSDACNVCESVFQYKNWFMKNKTKSL